MCARVRAKFCETYVGKASPSVPKKHRRRPGLSRVTNEEAMDERLTVPVRRHAYSTCSVEGSGLWVQG